MAPRTRSTRSSAHSTTTSGEHGDLSNSGDRSAPESLYRELLPYQLTALIATESMAAQNSPIDAQSKAFLSEASTIRLPRAAAYRAALERGEAILEEDRAIGEV